LVGTSGPGGATLLHIDLDGKHKPFGSNLSR
jgi:hypothetical protein